MRREVWEFSETSSLVPHLASEKTLVGWPACCLGALGWVPINCFRFFVIRLVLHRSISPVVSDV